MQRKTFVLVTCLLLALILLQGNLTAQIDPKDYGRADKLRSQFQSLALNIVNQSGWIGKSDRFWYRKTIKGGTEYYFCDAKNQTKEIAFDHQKLASSLTTLLKEEIDAMNLPFRTIQITGGGKTLSFEAGGFRYSCDLKSYEIKKMGEARRFRRSGFTMWQRGPAPEAASAQSKSSPDKKWEVFIKNFNIHIRSKDTGVEFPLSFDGSEGNYYT
ncbi:hypothetical protein ACFLT9_01420, partial [Acidobacteriota bacterium]